MHMRKPLLMFISQGFLSGGRDTNENDLQGNPYFEHGACYCKRNFLFVAQNGYPFLVNVNQ